MISKNICCVNGILRTQQTLPQHHARDYPKADPVRHPPENSLRSEQEKIEYLEEGRRVEVVDAEERGRGTRNEDADLVEEVVGRVEGAVMFERGRREGKEQHRVEAEIDGVFGDKDEEKGKHTSGWDDVSEAFER